MKLTFTKIPIIFDIENLLLMSQGSDFCREILRSFLFCIYIPCSGVDSGGAGGARGPPEFEDSLKGRSLISAYRSLAITASTSGFQKLSTALILKLLLIYIDSTGK